jgi:hypothetical protein
MFRLAQLEFVGPMICKQINGKRMQAGSTLLKGASPSGFESRNAGNESRSRRLSPLFVAAAIMIRKRTANAEGTT